MKKPRLENVTTDGTNALGKLNRPPQSNHKTPSLNDRNENSVASSSTEVQVQANSNGKIKLSPSFKKIVNTSPIVKLKKITNSDAQQPTIRRYPNRVRRPPANVLVFDDASSRASSTTSTKDKQEKKDKKKPVRPEDMSDWSECNAVALEHDKKYNFFPEPGPSHINFYENVSLPGYYALKSTNDTMIADDETQNDLHIDSMYDASMIHQSPKPQITHSPNQFFNVSDLDDDLTSNSPFQISTPLLNSIKANFQSPCNRLKSKHGYIAAPVTITPTARTVLTDLINFDLPQVMSKSPFYSNCDDATNVKEVGQHILHIPNQNECETFQSSLITTGLDAWRRNIFMNIMSMDDKEKLLNKSMQEIREFFAVEKRIVITSSRAPPSVRQAVLWCRNKRNCNGDDEVKIDADNDSPIQIKREKAKIILENGAGGGDDDTVADEEEDNECDVSLSCSPLTVLTKSQDSKLTNKHLTKLSRRSVKAKKSLNSTFDELKNSIVVRESPTMFSDCGGGSESPTNAVHDSDEEIPSSQVITIKHLQPKNNNNNHVNGHTDNTSNCRSDSSPLVNSVS